MASDKVLIIDDEPSICRSLSLLLEHLGYKVIFCNNPAQGIKEASLTSYDAIMIDLKMPEIDGITVLKEIKKNDPAAVAVMMTGYPSFETVQDSIRSGAFDYIAKPFNKDEISFVLSRAISYRQLVLTNKRLMEELKHQNTLLENRVSERTKGLTTLYEIGQDIVSSIDIEKVLETIVDHICKTLNPEICALLLLDDKSKKLFIKTSRGLTSEIINSASINIGEDISGKIFQERITVLTEDIQSDPRFSYVKNETYYKGSFMSVPLVLKEKVIGVINLTTKADSRPFSEDNFELLNGISAKLQ